LHQRKENQKPSKKKKFKEILQQVCKDIDLTTTVAKTSSASALNFALCCRICSKTSCRTDDLQCRILVVLVVLVVVLLLLLLYLWSRVSELFTWSQICLHNSDLLLHFQKWLGLLIIIIIASAQTTGLVQSFTVNLRIMLLSNPRGPGV
jgi:hypothetical protein